MQPSAWTCAVYFAPLVAMSATSHQPMTTELASLLAPFIYLQITGAAAWGWLIWRQLPDALTWAGIIVICSCGVASSLIEWHRARPRTP